MHDLRNVIHNINMAAKALRYAHGAQDQRWDEGTAPHIVKAKAEVFTALLSCGAATSDLARNQSGAPLLPEAVNGAMEALSSAVCHVEEMSKAARLPLSLEQGLDAAWTALKQCLAAALVAPSDDIVSRPQGRAVSSAS